MEFDFLKPVNDEVLELVSGLNSQHLGSKIVLHTNEQFPDLNKIKIEGANLQANIVVQKR